MTHTPTIVDAWTEDPLPVPSTPIAARHRGVPRPATTKRPDSIGEQEQRELVALRDRVYGKVRRL